MSYRAGGEEDFDMFLECVRARSLAAKTQLNDTRGMWMNECVN